MKYYKGAALAAIAIFGSTALLSAPAAADDLQIAEVSEVSATGTSQLQRELEERALKDAQAMSADAMKAADSLDLTVHLDLDFGPASHTSRLMASEL